jgi:hypothetical protein
MAERLGLSHPSPGYHVAAIRQPVKGRDDVTRGSGASFEALAQRLDLAARKQILWESEFPCREERLRQA